jgi:membrane protease YdiL (CAAX protease family)
MTTLLIFITYLVAALVLSALLFFPVFQAVNAIWEIRPDRVFYRLAMFIAIAGFWPCIRILGINNLDSIGYSLAPARFLRICAKGLGIGVIIMLVHATQLVLLGARMPEPGELHFSELLQPVITGLISGILVAFIEETFFRGAMYHHMRRHSHVWTTLIITSLFYAAVHFMRPSIPAGGLIIDWSSGFTMLLSMLHQYKEFADIADSFVALFFAGLFLGLVRERSGNIALCIGIHAGWVLIIKLAGELTEVDRQSTMNFLIGDYDGIIGWAATGILVLVTLGYWSYGRIKR